MLGIYFTRKDFSPSNVMIEGRKLLGSIRLRLMIEDMMTYVTFHVIHDITSTNLLLGGMHEHKVGPSTWHQSFKSKTPGKTIFANTKPFPAVQSTNEIKIESEGHKAIP